MASNSFKTTLPVHALPQEIVLRIAANIESGVDLRAFATCCRACLQAWHPVDDESEPGSVYRRYYEEHLGKRLGKALLWREQVYATHERDGGNTQYLTALVYLSQSLDPIYQQFLSGKQWWKQLVQYGMRAYFGRYINNAVDTAKLTLVGGQTEFALCVVVRSYQPTSVGERFALSEMMDAVPQQIEIVNFTTEPFWYLWEDGKQPLAMYWAALEDNRPLTDLLPIFTYPWQHLGNV